MSLLGASIITCAILYGLLAAILVAVFIVTEVPIFIAFAIVIAVIVVQFLIAPFITDLVQKHFYKTDFTRAMPDYLEAFIRETCEANGIKYPKIGFIDDGAPNAFTYGRTKSDARIVLTRGIFELLDQDEVKAVVAHEIGHIAHYDMAVMTMVQVVPMIFYMVYSILLDGSSSSKSSDDDTDYSVVIGVVAYVLYIVSEYVILWLSRVREYYADEFSAETTGNPNALASALVNIGFGLSTRSREKGSSRISASGESTLGIFDAKSSKSMVIECYNNGVIDKMRIKGAMKWELWNPWAFFYELGSTHPLISKRIVRLDKISEQGGKEAFVNFDLVKPESYVDEFVQELAVSALPTIALLATVVVIVLAFVRTPPSGNFPLFAIGIGLAVTALASIAKYLFTHPRATYHEANTAGLLSEVKVSMIRSIPCELTGTIIGRGNPGCIFNEDFTLRDETGILFLDYNQPLWIVNKLFALFKSPEYFDKQVKVRGWYRRGLVPFLEVYSLEMDGQVKKVFTYGFGWGWRIALLALGVAVIIAGFVL